VEACERAHYLGAIDSGRMGACYGACDLVLNTSASEGESNAILEAMLIGRAVIARNNAGNRALIESERTGVLFETREELAAGIQRLLAEDVHRAALEAAAQASVRDRADVGVEIRAHLDFYGKRGPVGGPSAQRS
jgi:glycosyltransferase involved in cell wall biosynthesis